jgi:hypothetical protein
MENLTPNDHAKLQNILNYYTEYRKAHYDDNAGIAIENKMREENQIEIRKELQKLQDAKETKQYLVLSNEKSKIYEQIEEYENIIYNDNDEDTIELKKINEALGKLYSSVESVIQQQLDIVKTEGVNVEFLENNHINVMMRLDP